jgi:hypothetical protein
MPTEDRRERGLFNDSRVTITAYSMLSYPAQAGYPVFTGVHDKTEASRRTGSSAFADDDGWREVRIRDKPPRSRGTMCPSDARTVRLSITEGAGKAGCQVHTRSLACKMEKARKLSHHRYAQKHPAFPARMVLTVSFALSLVSRAFLPPSPAQCASIVANLISASGYQDHATSPSARDVVRRTDIACVHRIPRPTFVTIAIRPSWRARNGCHDGGDLRFSSMAGVRDTLARRANHCGREKTCQGFCYSSKR